MIRDLGLQMRSFTGAGIAVRVAEKRLPGTANSPWCGEATLAGKAEAWRSLARFSRSPRVPANAPVRRLAEKMKNSGISNRQGEAYGVCQLPGVPATFVVPVPEAGVGRPRGTRSTRSDLISTVRTIMTVSHYH
jgi:hypothetical protein